jgi:hypothetical protein
MAYGLKDSLKKIALRRAKLEKYVAEILFRVKLANGEISRNLFTVAGWEEGL